MWQQVVAFVLELIAYATGSTALAVFVFKVYGDKWLDNKFKERLKFVEHGYAVELSNFKQRLDTAANGLNRIHQKEFEVLPEAWGLLDEAMNTLRWVVSPVQSYPNVSRMDNEDWKDFLDGVEAFSKAEKRYLLDVNSCNRQTEYNRLYDSHKNRLAEKAIGEFQKYAARHSIFLPEDLRSQFDEIRNLLWSACVTKSVGQETGDWKIQAEGWTKLEQQAEPLFQETRRANQNRIAKQMELNIEGLNMVKA